MGFARSGTSGRAWWKEEGAHRCAWRWDAEDRLMRCYGCGKARLATAEEERYWTQRVPGDPEQLNIRAEGQEGDA